MKYLILHRAIKNFGDFLIFERGKRLIEVLIPEATIFTGNAYTPLEKQFSNNEINNFDLIIIPGGPGIRGKIYPNVYPLKTTIPIIFLGVGSNISYWKVLNNNITVNFSEESYRFLKNIEKFAPLGVRDYITKKILSDVNIASQMNGCPAWYDFDYFGKEFERIDKINKIILSSPSKKENLNQFIDMIKILRKIFFDVEIFISFNHGFFEENKNSTHYYIYKSIFDISKKMNLSLIDMSGSIKNSSIYDECDLHIGYRVHTHIYFISHRKPSYLIAEDSRAIGVCKAIPTPYFKSWENTKFNQILLKTIYKKFKIPISFKNISENVIFELFNDIESNFSRFKGIGKIIDSYFENNMKKYILKYISR
ncbi:Polysaccharide pyruvyl transferase [Marinitoga hydrogenitolerans DSM 16785]|uniref:Polysaccharide pyruvyl transferase n=1 Tax=Marinitoga hydrogenitolerans (strain DSM 16785 / JCM 12826 / AT1271) TaxID=1122195 RepID=A0A1M4Y4F8_MARH1|nr:polysaccharide pyruvyl transferase family protein [Marinitoga hydrogenitolerans]SHF00362.1 Polysaccharide pyruvyl transferase [Marinitoga hydrogenitolerans DSM 16785]